MKVKKVFFLFLLWRIFDFLILFFAPRFLPYLGFFPYKEILRDYHLPDFISKLANFDGIHYLLIARQGYSQYEQAFFPLYPLLIKLTTPLFFGNGLIAALFLSNLSFLLGLWILSKYLKLILTNFNQFQLILSILTFPTSFFFGAVYTEGLFLFLLVSSLYFLKKENYFLAATFAFFASLTRIIGVFLIIPFLFHFLHSQKSKPKNFSCSMFHVSRFMFTILSPLFGLLLYSLYLWRTTGDPLFFFSSQPVFGANRSTNLILLPQVYFRYFKIFLTSSWSLQYFISLVEFLIFSLVFIILIVDLLKKLKFKVIPNKKYQITNNELLSLNLFSLANLLLPTLTGTFSSIPRYALFSLSFFIFLAQIKNNWIKIFIALLFFIFHMIILALFGQGYFVS